MNANRRHAVAALTAAGLLWGTTVPLSKLALVWLSPGWLTLARFGLAAAILLVAARATLRTAFSPAVLVSGAIGYGGSVVVQNAGISRTSVSHAALLVGAAPVLIAIIAALWQRTVARPVAWAGFALSLAGVALVARAGGGGATAGGDGLVLASVLISGTFTVAQTRLLPGRDPVAVTAVQFLGAAIVMLPIAVVTGGMPTAPTSAGAVLATVALVAAGTLLPFTLFAYGQSRVSAEVAGAFLNLEPLVGAIAGVVVFGNPAGLEQVTGGAAVLAGIALSSLPMLASGRRVAARRPSADPVLLAGAASAGPGQAARQARPLVQGDQVPRVRVVVGEPDLPRAGAGFEREPLGAGGHGGAQGVPALIGPVHARAGVGRAVPVAAAVPGDVDVAAAPRQQDRARRGDRDGLEVAVDGGIGQRLPGPAGAAEVDPLELLAHAGLRGAAQCQDDAGGGGDLNGRPLRARRDERAPAGRAVRRAGQQRRRRLGTAKVRGRRGHQARPSGNGHHGAGRAPHHPLSARGTGDRPPAVPRRRRGVDAEQAARGVVGEWVTGHRGDHAAVPGGEARARA
jgi:O-acetylserine/cysteine efflux transporter